MKTLGNTGEHRAIEQLVQSLGDSSQLRVGAGDDAAVCALPGAEWEEVLTSDPIIEGVHFLKGEVPERVGHKAVGRILSDLAAMGAQPKWILVNVVAPEETEVDWIERVYSGLNALAARFGAVVVGGDLARGPVLELHLFGTGLVPAGQAVLRSGARPGDALFVTGALGESFSGKHLDFIPRVEEGIFLRESGRVHAMMDLSDGLATDLRHILAQSGVGAMLETEQIPCVGSLDGALRDGEDFELLLAVDPAEAVALESDWIARFGEKLYRIGEVTADAGELYLLYPDGRSERLNEKGFEHFAKKDGES